MSFLSPDAIRRLRTRLGVTQGVFARKVGGVTANTVARWERGEMAPRGLSLEALNRLATKHPGRKSGRLPAPRLPRSRFPRVEVEWTNAVATRGWKAPEAHTLRLPTEPPMRSVGFLLLHDARQVVIAQSLSGSSSDVAESLSIPSGCVRKVRRMS